MEVITVSIWRDIFTAMKYLSCALSPTVTLAGIHREGDAEGSASPIAPRSSRANSFPPPITKDVSTGKRKFKRDRRWACPRRGGEAFYITLLITCRIHVAPARWFRDPSRKMAGRINRLIERGLRRTSLPSSRSVITDSRGYEMADRPFAPPPAGDDPGRREKIARLRASASRRSPE